MHIIFNFRISFLVNDRFNRLDVRLESRRSLNSFYDARATLLSASIVEDHLHFQFQNWNFGVFLQLPNSVFFEIELCQNFKIMRVISVHNRKLHSSLIFFFFFVFNVFMGIVINKIVTYFSILYYNPKSISIGSVYARVMQVSKFLNGLGNIKYIPIPIRFFSDFGISVSNLYRRKYLRIF